MDGIIAAGILKMFFSAVSGGIGKAVPQLISLGIPGSEILLAAEVLGIDLINDPRVSEVIKVDESLQRYLEIDLDNGLDNFLDNKLE